MAAVSYLQNIDTRPVEYKPYKLPWQGFMQEFSAKNQYFAESANMIQQSYKNVLGLDPLFAQNKEYLKNFLDKAQKDLSKVVKSDMTVTDNAVNAANVFKPIFDTSKKENRLLLTDSQLNKFYKEEGQKAQQARTTKNGAGWNRNNQFYFENQYQKYKEAAERGEDPNTIEDHYAKRKGFIPYYDILPDLEKVKKLCHEDSQTNTGVNKSNYLMLETHSASGVSQSKMQNCLGFLPEAAKQQIGINSYANYNGNKQGLMSDYKSYFVDNKKSEYDAALFKYAAAAGYKGKDPVKLADIQELKALQEQKELEYNNGTTEWNNMLNGKSERDYVEDNYDNISSVVGNVKFTERGAKAMSWQEIENTLSANAAGIAQFKQKGDIYMQQLKFNQQQQLAEQNFGYDVQLESMKGQIAMMKEGMKLDMNGKVVTSENPQDANLLPDTKPQGKKDFDERVSDAFNNMNSSVQGINNSALTHIEGNVNLTTKQKQDLKVNLGTGNLDGIANFIDAYDKMDINDPMVDANIKVFNESRRKYMALEYEKKNIIAAVPLPTATHNLKMNDGRSIVLSDTQMIDLNKGKTVRNITKNDLQQFDYYVRPAILNMELYEDKVEEQYKNQWLNSSKYYFTPETKTQAETRVMNMKNKFGISDEYDISSYYTDKDGNAVFKVTQQIKDDNGVKSTKTLSSDEMKQLNIPGVSIETFGGTGKQKNVFFKASNYTTPLASYIDPELQNSITVFTQAQMPKTVGTWADNGDDLEITSDSGKEWKIKIGTIADSQSEDGRPIYKTSMKVKGKWLESPIPSYSIPELVQMINTKQW